MRGGNRLVMLEKVAPYWRILLIFLGWGAVCFLLYFFVLSPSTEDDLQPEPEAQHKKQPKVASSLTKSPPPHVQSQEKDPFELNFSESEIEEAKEVVNQFLDVFYEGDRTKREAFIDQLKPYTTDAYLDLYRYANGLGEPIAIKEKHIQYVEQGRNAPQGAIGFHTVVITDEGDYFSSIYYLTRVNGTWRIAKEEEGLVPEE